MVDVKVEKVLMEETVDTNLTLRQLLVLSGTIEQTTANQRKISHNVVHNVEEVGNATTTALLSDTEDIVTEMEDVKPVEVTDFLV